MFVISYIQLHFSFDAIIIHVGHVQTDFHPCLHDIKIEPAQTESQVIQTEDRLTTDEVRASTLQEQAVV